MAEVVAIEDPNFQPAMRVVTSITNANPAVVTTSFDHDYNTGLIVSFRIPEDFGMQQICRLYGTITVTGPDTFTVNIDTSKFDSFSVPAGNRQYAQVLPVGEVTSSLASATANVL